MRFSLLPTLVVALAADGAIASSWFSKAAYNKWHETELERWLSDHDVPYPTPADRKDLENLVKENWDANVVTPYQSWDTNRLQSYLGQKGKTVKKGTEQNKDSLVNQVQASWHETGDQATEAYDSVKDWIFDTYAYLLTVSLVDRFSREICSKTNFSLRSWTDSQLKAFLDYHGVPNPTPRTRDSLLKTVRENYSKAADKTSEAAAYPGNWLYQSWSESDLKSWLDERGLPAPQPSNRDKLIASVRRNSRIAAQQYNDAIASVTDSATASKQSLTDALLDAWSDAQIKNWCDSNGIKVPQGTKRNELIALARKHRSKLLKESGAAASSAASAYGAATSSAGNQYAKATDDATLAGSDIQDTINEYIIWAKEKLGLEEKGAAASFRSAAAAAKSTASKASKSASSAAASGTNKAKEEL
ncbi:MAG: hypothetical protein M1820_009552 [Bogoriella megaspora]|nr:MAG: hypothetical protein M1820_009552 [Bogoriella megaspora]